MNQEEYRAQVDAVPFSPDFQDRTVARLMSLEREKERKTMKKVNLKAGLIAAAMAAVMVVGAYAAVTLLSPGDVAQHVGREPLAAAFESERAVTVNETRTVGDYRVTLMGLVSGDGLEGLEVTRDRTYAVLAYERTDGVPIEEDVPELTASPLVEGYAPWVVNAWTLNGAVASFAQEGVLYYLLDCDAVEPFADRTVYLAVYPGTHIPPNAETFAISDEGHISIVEGADAALFTLPLDESKADPQRVAELGFDAWEPLEMDPTEGEPFSGEVRLDLEELAEEENPEFLTKDYTQTPTAILPSLAPQE